MYKRQAVLDGAQLADVLLQRGGVAAAGRGAVYEPAELALLQACLLYTSRCV